MPITYPAPLQGGIPPLQGTIPNLQGGANPQPQAPAPTATPAAVQVPPAFHINQSQIGTGISTTAPNAAPQIGTGISTTQPVPAPLNSIFQPYIDFKPSQANPGGYEYFRKDTNQTFATPPDLFNYASTLGAGQVNSFDQLHAPVNAPASPGAQPPATNQNQQLAETAGNAGLSVDDLTKLAQANSALTPEEITSIRQSLGINDLTNLVFTPPSQNTVDLYNQAYNQAGLPDLKSRILDLTQKITQAQQDFVTAQGTLNENPFLSEISRTQRMGELNNEAQARIANLQNEQQNLNTLYTQGLTETNAFVTRYTNDFNTQRTIAAAKLDYLTKLADQQAQATIAAKEQKVYRYLPEYLTAKQKAAEPFGNAQYGYFKYNPQTKSYDQVSGPAAQFEANPATGELFNKATGQPVGASTGLTSAFGAPAPAQTNPSQTNNNPGNLRNASGQFAVFTTPQQGWQALLNDIQAKTSGNNAHGLGPNSTLRDFFSVYAPSGDGSNDPTSYAASVAQQLGVTPDTKLSDLSGKTQELATAIATHEGYFNGQTTPGSFSGNLIDQAAQALVDGTAAPSQYSKRGATYNAILNRANQLSQQQKGTPFDTQQAEVNFSNKETVRPILNLEQSLNSHLDTLLQLSSQLDRSDSPIVNKATFAAKQETGPGTVLTQYLQTAQDAKGELAKMLSGGGTPTDEARSEADAMLNEYLGHNDLTASIQNAKTLAHQKAVAYTNPTNGAANPQPAPASNVDISDITF